jgi:hypothetical protein
MRAIPIALAAIGLLAWGADRMFANSSRLSASVVSANRADWYPEARARGGGCRVEWRTEPLRISYVMRTQRLDCDGADAERKLFVVGDSHATAYIAMLADYARQTRVPVAVYQTPGCYFVHLIPSAAGCAATVDVVLDAIRNELKPGDVVFMPSLRVPRFGDQWGEGEVDVAATWKAMLKNADAGFAEALAVFEKLNVAGSHFVFELPKPVFPTPLFRCGDWFNRGNPACGSGTEMPRARLEQHREPVLAFAEKLKRGVAGFSTWDPFPVLCPGTTCSMLKDGKPLFFDGDHISGIANRLLVADFTKKMDELGMRTR